VVATDNSTSSYIGPRSSPDIKHVYNAALYQSIAKDVESHYKLASRTFFPDGYLETTASFKLKMEADSQVDPPDGRSSSLAVPSRLSL
jgi:hypothetical protein